MRQKLNSLLDFPELGPTRENLAPNLRVMLYQNYAVYYSFTDGEVIVVRVLHARRDAAAIFMP